MLYRPNGPPVTSRAHETPGSLARPLPLNFRDIIDNDFVDEHEVGLKVVTIRAGDGGFVTDDDCGTWTRVRGHMALEGQRSATSSEEAIRRTCQQNEAQEKAARSGLLELEPRDRKDQ